MASDYDWGLPSFEDSGGWTDTDNYSFADSGDGGWAESYDFGGSGGSSNESYDFSGGFDFNDEDWYVDSTNGGSAESEDGILDGIWSWVKSDQGVSMLGGAAGGLIKMWAADRALDRQKELAKAKGGGGGGGSNAAALQDARIAKHNASINTPMDMGLVQFKRP